MEPLIFKIETQADDSGVRKFDKSIGGLDVSSRKAAGALKNFSRDLVNAKSGADVAAAGAESLSRVLEKSLAGVVVIGGIKIVTDQINKMAETLRAVGESSKAAVTQLERMGDIKGIDDAIKQVGVVNQNLDTITQKLGSIQEGNWFTKLTASITGTTEELEKQQATFEKLRDSLIAYGFATEKDNSERMSQLNDEQKQYEAIQQKLRKNLDTINQIKDANDRASATQSANALAGIETQNLTNKLMEEQAKKENDLNEKRQKAIEDQIKKEKELGEAQQKRFNELYNAEIKSQEQMQKRIDAELKAAQELADKKATLEENVRKAEGAPLGEGVVGGGGGAGTAPGLAATPGQRETAAARGAREQGERAFEKGRKQEQERARENIAQQLKDKGQASDRNAVTNEIIRRSNEEAAQRGANSEGLKQYNDAIASAKAEQQAFNDSLKNSSEATRDYGSELGKGMSELVPEFDKAQKGVDNFSNGLTENSGNMIDDFLKTGKESDDLGQDFDRTGDEVNRFGQAVKKATPPPSQDKGKAGKGLGDIYALLDENLKEMRTYAFVK